MSEQPTARRQAVPGDRVSLLTPSPSRLPWPATERHRLPERVFRQEYGGEFLEGAGVVSLREERSGFRTGIRQGTREMLAAMIEAEVDDYIQEHAGLTDENGRRLVVRNG